MRIATVDFKKLNLFLALSDIGIIKVNSPGIFFFTIFGIGISQKLFTDFSSLSKTKKGLSLSLPLISYILFIASLLKALASIP